MDTNQTLAHLAAEMAELREKMVKAERSAIHWKNRYEEVHGKVHHLEDANVEYAQVVDEQREEILRLDRVIGEHRRELEAVEDLEEAQ
jgi:chromosome segregation ATPase